MGVGRASSYLPELETLRGIAIILFYAFHLDALVLFPLRNHGTDVPWPMAFVRAGHTGVTLFFVLSAFLLSSPFLAEAQGGRHVDRKRYALRRCLRILPLYYAAVITAAALSADSLSALGQGLPYLLFLNGFPGFTQPLPPYSNVWWSLATEVQFYVLLPLLPLVLKRRRVRWCLPICMGAYLLAYSSFLSGLMRMSSIEGQLLLGYSVFGRAPAFMAGIALAWLHRRHGAWLGERLSRHRWLRLGACDLALLLVLAYLASELDWVAQKRFIETENVPFHVWHVREALAWGGVLFLVLETPLLAKRMLCNRAMEWVGLLSYSIYLVHLPVLHFGLTWSRQVFHPSRAGWNLEMVPGVVLVTALTLALSMLTYRFIERPFLAKKERVAG